MGANQGDGHSNDVEVVGRQSGKAAIILWATDGEVIERLPFGLRMKAEHAMHGIVKETANACGAIASGLGFQIQYLSNQPGFPKQAFLKPGAKLF